MKTTEAAYLLPWLVGSLMAAAAGPALAQDDSESFETAASASQVPPGTREYIAENGTSIRITTMGNVVRFESPRGFEHVAGRIDDPIHGYVLSYWDPRQKGVLRVVHNVYRSHSSTIKPGFSDFVPLAFDGPPSGQVFSRGRPVQATALVGTRDGYVQIKATITWFQGTVRVEYQLRTGTRFPVRIVSFKVQNRIWPDGGGDYGIKEPRWDVEAIQPGPSTSAAVGPESSAVTPIPGVLVLAGHCCLWPCCPFPSCACPPPPLPFSQEAISHVIALRIGPDHLAQNALRHQYISAANNQDPCERQSPGACQVPPLPLVDQDSVITAGFVINKWLTKGKPFLILTKLGS